MKPLDITINFLAYEGLTSNDPADATKIKNRVQESSVSALTRYQNQIADSTVDQSIDLPDANTEYLLVFIDREISIKVNGSSDSITLKPRANGTKTFAYYTRGDITSLSVSNSSGDSANVDIISVNQ